MASRLAAQMYTIREFTQTADDLADSLAKLSGIGYEAVQLSAIGAMDGDHPHISARQARQLLEDNGLKCIATHRSWRALSEATEAEIAFHRELNCEFVAIGGLPHEYAALGAGGYARFVEEAAPTIAHLKEAGIRFGYHNHDFEFQRIGLGQRTMYDLFIERGGPDFNLELDVYWAVHAGVNPVRIFERCPGRVPVIHLKDKEVVPKDGPVMAPIGEGNLDWAGILPACLEAGVEWYAVEQDECRRDPFDCLRSSFEYLTALGL